MMGRKLSFHASAADIRRWLLEGLTYEHIGERNGVSKGVVSQRARCLGVQSTAVVGHHRRGTGGRWHGLDKPTRILPPIRKIRDHYENDHWNLTRIGREYGVSVQAVTKAVTRAGFRRRDCVSCWSWFLASGHDNVVCRAC